MWGGGWMGGWVRVCVSVRVWGGGVCVCVWKPKVSEWSWVGVNATTHEAPESVVEGHHLVPSDG